MPLFGNRYAHTPAPCRRSVFLQAEEVKMREYPSLVGNRYGKLTVIVYLNTLTSKYEKWLRLESMRSGQPGVNAEQYRNYAFRCPNYQTQVKIANIIKGIDSKILKERMSLSKLNSLKNGLLQQLFI